MSNPFSVVGNPRQGSTRNLDEYCDWLNRQGFVIASGKPYRISRLEDGTRYLDRAA